MNTAAGHVRFLRTSDGEAYGFTVGGKVYMDSHIATSETAVHEYTHLWADMLKRTNCAFSQVVTMVRLTFMYFIDFIAFMENPDRTWDDILAKEALKAPPEPTLFD